MKRIRRITHACFQRKPIRTVHHHPAAIERKRKRYRNMNKVEKTTDKDLTTTSTSILQTSDSEYVRLSHLFRGCGKRQKRMPPMPLMLSALSAQSRRTAIAIRQIA